MREPAVWLVAIVFAGCAARPQAVELEHDAYVWQRAWTGTVDAAVAGAPDELDGLRVLALELGAGGDAVWIGVDLEALAASGRPVTAVVRIDGSRPPAALDPAVVARLAGWRDAGVDLVGIEIDHDCATAALGDYARWLAAARPPAPLAWSITALPTWAGSPALAGVAAAVDELVVQVHAIRAPTLFERDRAEAWLRRFAAAVPGRPLRVALPTYRARVGGEVRAADPAEVGGLVRALERRPVPGLRGVVWFRLPVAGDHQAWSAPTLRAVIRGEAVAAEVTAALVARGPAVYDVVVENRGTADGRWPALAVTGAVDAIDLIGGYRRDGDRWTPAERKLRPGARVVVGWVTGKELAIDVAQDDHSR